MMVKFGHLGILMIRRSYFAMLTYFFPNVHTLSWSEYRGCTVINGLVLQWMRGFEPRKLVHLSIMMCLLDTIIDVAFVSFSN
jgi:hypothetical protein